MSKTWNRMSPILFYCQFKHNYSFFIIYLYLFIIWKHNLKSVCIWLFFPNLSTYWRQFRFTLVFLKLSILISQIYWGDLNIFGNKMCSQTLIYIHVTWICPLHGNTALELLLPQLGAVTVSFLLGPSLLPISC